MNWWDAPTDPQHDSEAVHYRVFDHVKAVEEAQADIHTQNILNAKLYSNRDMMTFEWDGTNTVSHKPLNGNLENIIQTVVDTVNAMIGKNNPKPTVQSRGADFDVYLKARQLDRFLWCTFQSQKTFVEGEKAFLHSTVFGTGVVKIDIDGDDVYTEAVIPDEIIVDQRECMSCQEPEQLHQRKLVSRLFLLGKYGNDKDLKDKILKAQAHGFHYTSYMTPGIDQLVILESWKLPSGDQPGRHTICIENATLVDEEYTRTRFPFAFLRYADPLSGFYGRSLVEALLGYQIRQNELNSDIRTGQNMMCVPRILVDQGSSIVKSQFDNAIGKILTYRGVKPEAVTWNAFNPEIYNERDRNYEKAFRASRISDLSSQAKLPSQARLDSSEALREFSAIEQEGFTPQAKALERFYMEIAEHYLELYAILYRDRGVNKAETYRSKYLVQQIKWEDVDMEADKYVLEISASSVLNMTPAARKDTLKDWLMNALITPDEYKAMSGHPDLEAKTDLMSAAQDFVEMQIDKMLDGKAQTPDPLSNLQLCLKQGLDTYLHLSAIEAPDEILSLFRDYVDFTKEYILGPQRQAEEQASAQAAEMAMAPPMDPMMAGADPMAAGMAPPGPPMPPGPPGMGGPPVPPGIMPV